MNIGEPSSAGFRKWLHSVIYFFHSTMIEFLLGTGTTKAYKTHYLHRQEVYSLVGAIPVPVNEAL